MSRQTLQTYSEIVVMHDGHVKVIACEGVGGSKKVYLTVLDSLSSTEQTDFHMSFNVRDLMLFLAFKDDGKDIGFSIPVNPVALRAMDQKLLALSARTTSN